jgi:hypothetical protein
LSPFDQKNFACSQHFLSARRHCFATGELAPIIGAPAHHAEPEPKHRHSNAAIAIVLAAGRAIVSADILERATCQLAGTYSALP